MTTKPIVGVDVDGVLADFIPGFLKISRRLHGWPPDNYVQTEWSFTDVGFSEEEHDRVWRAVRRKDNFWLELERLPDTGELMRRHLDFDLYFITNRFDTGDTSALDQTTRWLQNNFAIKNPNVIISKDKGVEAARLDLEYYIDDYQENLYSVREKSPNTRCFLKQATYNSHAHTSQRCDSEGITRVGTINDFIRGEFGSERRRNETRPREASARLARP